MNVYIDESGDLGWSFNRPYRHGGSSRYLTITFLLIPKELSSRPKRIVREMYRKRKQKREIELKGADLTPQEQIYFANKVIRLLDQYPDISISAITVKKVNVYPHIRTDENKLYNYMIKIALLEKIKIYPVVSMIRDKRSIKVESGRSLFDYLQTELWLALNVTTTLEDYPLESHNVLNLQFVDFLSHIIWSRYEDNESAPFNVLRAKVLLQGLYF